jgi:hypothetical protein
MQAAREGAKPQAAYAHVTVGIILGSIDIDCHCHFANYFYYKFLLLRVYYGNNTCLTDHGGQYGCETSRFLQCLDNWPTDEG